VLVELVEADQGVTKLVLKQEQVILVVAAEDVLVVVVVLEQAVQA
tara:strand:+ start:499 stop:633 length:135 start_codon:yes stop_codon:yes gene_type:complete